MFSLDGNNFSLHVLQKNTCRYYGPCDEIRNNFPPPIGSELFVARIPPQFPHKELLEVLSSAGPLYDVRVMLSFNKKNKGFAFVRYINPEVALNAIDFISKYKVFCNGKLGHLVATLSTDHHTLMLPGWSTDVSGAEVEQFWAIKKWGSPHSPMLRDLIPQNWGMRTQLDWKPNEEVNQHELYKLMETTSFSE